MSPKTSSWLLLRLAVLLAALLVQSSEGATYQDFVNRHIDFPKTRAANNNAYCNLMMQRRGMTSGSCKPTNTFINGKENDVKNTCQGGGTRVSGNLYDSKKRFRVVTCRNTGRYPNCQYRSKLDNKKVRVGCVNRLPVHFEKLV